MHARLRWHGPVYLIPNGTPTLATTIDAEPGTQTEGEERPRLAWIGRLVAHKRAELLVPVAARGYQIDVIGRGPGAAALSSAIHPAGIAEAGPHQQPEPDLAEQPPAGRGPAGSVRLHGYLAEEDKNALLSQSLLHLSTSQGEGWGLCVLEAAALGVPTVAFDVEGLRDSVLDGQTGWLVREGEDLADVVERAVGELTNPVRRAEMASACRAWAGQLSWERAGARMAALVAACVRRETSLTACPGAWIVAQDDGLVVAEGPVLDLLTESGGVLLRTATAAEQLLGEVSGAMRTVGTPMAR
jgi:glycosyltransferase involved in cell wall biosynthesis